LYVWIKCEIRQYADFRSVRIYARQACSVYTIISASFCAEMAGVNILFYFNPLNKRLSESLSVCAGFSDGRFLGET